MMKTLKPRTKNNIFRTGLILALALLSWSANAQSIQPAKISLNGQWLFKTDLYDRGEAQGWFKAATDTCDWEEMAVPGNWDLKNEYAEFVGKGWYRRTFEVPDSWKQRNARLVFQSVYNDAKVWINGKRVGEHHGGFLPFWFDVNEYLEYGRENTLVVVADNTFKRGATWNWGGIRRPVWIEVTPKVRLEYQHITAIPNLEKGWADVEIEFEVNNTGHEKQILGYDCKIEYAGQTLWTSSRADWTSFEIAPGEKVKKQLKLKLPKSKVHLWHFNHPYLYDVTTSLIKESQPVHQLKDRFGIRRIEIDGYDFKLNGETVRTVGFNLVAEDRTTGSTLPLWRIKEDVDMMKSLGANMARLSHLPLPKELLDYLDEKGIMIFGEVPLWGKDRMVDPENPLPKQWLEKMVQVQYNHPSVIGWSIGNEIGFAYKNPKAMDYIKGAIEHARQLDPNRLAVYVSNSASAQEVDPVQYSDMILFNTYGNWGKGVARAHELHPGKPIFMAEYGHQLNSEDLNEGTVDAAGMLNQFRGKEYMTGASLWTFNDYRSFFKAGETWTTPPSQNRTWGIVDVFRRKKRAYYAFRKEYAPVKDFNVEIKSGDNLSVKIGPRGKLDIPAYTLNGYKLVWHSFNHEGKVDDGGFETLPVIKPGDQSFTKTFSMANGKKPFGIRVDLLDPQDYSVQDTIIYFEPPETPKIRKVYTSYTTARVIINTQALGSGSHQTGESPEGVTYKVLYGKEKLDKETDPTINEYMDIENLDRLGSYQFAVVAINNAGESQPSEIVKAKLNEDELPPIIRATVPFDNRFFIGYSVDRTDYMYEIEYGKEPGKYDHHLGLRNVGVCQVPGLQPGQTYYYRMRRRISWGFASEWTPEIAVTLNNGDKSQSVAINGVVHNMNTAMICFDPVKKAIGYNISFKEKDSNEWQKLWVDQAVVRYAFIPGLRKNKDYDFKVEAVFE